MAENQEVNLEDSSEEESEEAESEEGDSVLSADNFEPEVRQHPWSNRQERAEFFKAKQQKKDTEMDLGDDADTKIENLVNERVGSILDEKLSKFAEVQDELLIKNEIKNFLLNPENIGFKKYENQVGKAAKVYQNVPISLIFRGLAYNDAFLAGAEKKTEVDKKIARNKISGTAKRRVDSGLPDFNKMKPEELAAWNARIPREGIKVEE